MDRELPYPAALAENFRKQIDPVPGQAGALEAQVVGADKQVDGAVGRRFALTLEAEDARGLGHGFEKQHAGKHRIAGKMPVEEGLVNAQILVRDNGFAGRQFQHPVDEQKRVAMGKVFADTFNIHKRLRRQCCCPP